MCDMRYDSPHQGIVTTTVLLAFGTVAQYAIKIILLLSMSLMSLDVTMPLIKWTLDLFFTINDERKRKRKKNMTMSPNNVSILTVHV